MGQRINVDSLWRSACNQTLLRSTGAERQRILDLGVTSPFALDELLVPEIDVGELVKRLPGLNLDT
jgi:hypothetical protein